MKIVLFLFVLINAVYGSDQTCKEIYIDQYIKMRNIPLNIKFFDNKNTFEISSEQIFLKNNYGLSKAEYQKIVDLHYYLNGKDRNNYCIDFKSKEDYQCSKLLELLHVDLIEKVIKTQNIKVAIKLFNEYDLIDGALAEGKIYEITLPLLIHMKKSKQLFIPNKKNINSISNGILAWIEANNNPYYSQSNSDIKREIPLSYDEYRKSIQIYYTVGLTKEDAISPNKSITYIDFLRILKSHDLNLLAQKIDNSLNTMYKNSI